MSKVFIVQAQGFGEYEDEMYNMGVYSTRARAEAAVQEILEDVEDAVTEIEEFEVDA